MNHCKSHSHPELVYSLKRSVENLHVKLCFSVHGSTHTHTHSLILHSGDHRLEIVQRPRPSRLFLTFSHTHTLLPLWAYTSVLRRCVCAAYSFDPQLKGTYRPNFQMRKSQPSRWRESKRDRMNSYTALGIGSRQLELLIYRCGPEREMAR